MVYLSKEIIVFEILTRVPARVVGRSKCVCKEWYDQLSRLDFVMLHCSRSLISSNQRILLIGDRTWSLHPINVHSGDYGPGTIKPFPFNSQTRYDKVISHLHGLVCVCLHISCELLLWNPTTGAYKYLTTRDWHGFYEKMDDGIGLYVDAHNDYKILHIRRRHGVVGATIYSRRVDCWRDIPFITRPEWFSRTFHFSSGTLCGDTLYFLVEETLVPSTKNVVICFDVNLEQYKEISFPLGPSAEIVSGSLINVKDELHMFLSTGRREMSIDLWKLKEERWVKVFSSPQIPPMTLSSWCTIRNYMTNGNWFVMTTLEKLYEIEVDTKPFEMFYTLTPFFCGEGALFVETVVSPTL